MRLDQLLEEKRGEILRIAAEHGARDVRVFGSVARGEADRQSDIDFLVELEAGRSLFDLGGRRWNSNPFSAAGWTSLPRVASRRVSASACCEKRCRYSHHRI